jgi:hypothetical protein
LSSEVIRFPYAFGLEQTAYIMRNPPSYVKEFGPAHLEQSGQDFTVFVAPGDEEDILDV